MHQPPPRNTVQWYLDENKRLILLLQENIRLRNLHECAELQEKFRGNLVYLATLADGQHLAERTGPSDMLPQITSTHGKQPMAQQPQHEIGPSNMPPQQQQQSNQGEWENVSEWMNEDIVNMLTDTDEAMALMSEIINKEKQELHHQGSKVPLSEWLNMPPNDALFEAGEGGIIQAASEDGQRGIM